MDALRNALALRRNATTGNEKAGGYVYSTTLGFSCCFQCPGLVPLRSLCIGVSNLYASSLWTADVNLKRPLFSLARFLCHARMWVHVVRLDAESGCVCVLRCLYKFPLVNRAKGKQRRQDSDEESDSDIPKAPRGANEWDT